MNKNPWLYLFIYAGFLLIILLFYNEILHIIILFILFSIALYKEKGRDIPCDGKWIRDNSFIFFILWFLFYLLYLPRAYKNEKYDIKL